MGGTFERSSLGAITGEAMVDRKLDKQGSGEACQISEDGFFGSKGSREHGRAKCRKSKDGASEAPTMRDPDFIRERQDIYVLRGRPCTGA